MFHSYIGGDASQVAFCQPQHLMIRALVQRVYQRKIGSNFNINIIFSIRDSKVILIVICQIITPIHLKLGNTLYHSCESKTSGTHTTLDQYKFRKVSYIGLPHQDHIVLTNRLIKSSIVLLSFQKKTTFCFKFCLNSSVQIEIIYCNHRFW